MKTECQQTEIEFQGLDSRRVVANFSGGDITTDTGLLLLRECDNASGLFQKVAECFEDYRDQERTTHTIQQLVTQRIMAIAAGYEDLNDHDILRNDPAMALAAGKCPVKDGPLAGKSTLQRLEAGPLKGETISNDYHKIKWNIDGLDNVFMDFFFESMGTSLPSNQWIILDIDPTDVTLHGEQECRFFQAHYHNYCYLPTYIFCGRELLRVRLRPADISPIDYTALFEFENLIKQIRSKYPEARILLRADSTFAVDELMSWCEQQDKVDYIFGLCRNSRLNDLLKPYLKTAEQRSRQSGESVRVFHDFKYRTHTSWTKSRRIIGKAEHTLSGSNPRYIVTSLKGRSARHLYEKIYCARGDMENRIKEQQLDLFGNRLSGHMFFQNQLRLYFSGFAYLLFELLRRHGLQGTELEGAYPGTIRLKLLKFAAEVTVSVRRVLLAISTSWPGRSLLLQVFHNLRNNLKPILAPG